jgi:hypothetical protein
MSKRAPRPGPALEADAGDARQHAPDEGIDDLERRDVDQHRAGTGRLDLVGQVVLQRHGRAILEVDLDRHQQAVAHLEDRDARHHAMCVRVTV